MSSSAGSYNVIASTLNKVLSAFSVSSGTCTSVTYVLTTSAAGVIDSSVFIFTAASLQLAVTTSNIAKIGTYSFTLTGTLTGDT